MNAPVSTSTTPSNEPNRVTRDSRAPRSFRLLFALTLLFIVLRCWMLTADAPLSVFGRDARELFAEPPAKSHEARNWAMFGAFKVSPVDDYQFWRAQSPAWVYPLAGFFRVFGTDYPQLRIFSTLYAALGFALMLAIAARFMRTSTWCFIGLALALDPLYFHTSRVGFIEPAVGTWVTLAVFALLLAERDLRWFVLAVVASTLAVFTKQAGLFVAPLIAFSAIHLGVRAARTSAQERRKLWLVLAAALLVAAIGLIYIASSDYLRALAYNYKHVLLGAQAPAQNRYRGVSSLLFRLYDPERYTHFIGAMPITGVLAALTLLYFVVRAVRARRWPEYAEVIVFGWFVCSLIAMEVIAKSQLRFWTIVIPAAAVVAGIGIDWARDLLHVRRASLAPLPLAVPLVALLVLAAYGHIKYARAAVYTVRDGAALIQQQIGDRDATIVGFPSPGIVLGTPYKNFYVRGGFNQTRDQLQALGITHFLFRRDGRDRTREIVEHEFPDFMSTLRPELALEVRTEPLQLFEVEQPLRQHASAH
jgi:hypothetical protein